MINSNNLRQWVENNSDAMLAFAVKTYSPPQLHTDALNGVEVILDDGEIFGVVSLSDAGVCKLEAVYPSTGNFLVLESHKPQSASELHALLAQFLSNIRRTYQSSG